MTSLDLNLSSKSDWIEVFPFGVAMGASGVRPVMIFKDKDERRVLPVWMSPMDAGIAVSQSSTHYMSGSLNVGSPHELTWRIFAALNIQLEKCIFKTVRGQHQYLELHFKAGRGRKLPDDLRMLEAPVDDALSFCLRSGCKFFTTFDYIEKSRVLEGQVAMGGMHLAHETNPHPYLN